MKTVLLTGSSGLLGKYLRETKPDSVDLKCTYHEYAPVPARRMDIMSQDAIKSTFDEMKPDVVIHCAANGDVDYAEENYEKSCNINVKGTLNIMAACREYQSKLVFMSTNAVFDGNSSPYKESDERKPQNKYGEIKVDAENKVASLKDWMIVRPIMLYGWPYMDSRSNFVSRVLFELIRGKKIQTVGDVVTQPTYAKDCAFAIWSLIDRGKWNEVYHVAGNEPCTLYELAISVAGVFGLNEDLIEMVNSDYFETIAPRPKNTTYDLTKTNALNITCRGVLHGLKAMRDEK